MLLYTLFVRIPQKKRRSSRSLKFENRPTNLDFLLRQFLAASHFADLMALVVTARSARGAIVFPHTSDAFTATLPLLLRLFAITIHAGIVTVRATSHRMNVRMFKSTGSAGNARDLRIRCFAT